MRRAHINVKARVATPSLVRAVAPLARMRQAVAAAILVCDKTGHGEG